MVPKNLFKGQQSRNRYTEQAYGHGERGGEGLAAEFFTTETLGKPNIMHNFVNPGYLSMSGIISIL